MKAIVTFLLTLNLAFLAQGRLTRTWTYQELYDQADLVVIGKPVATQNTDEKASLPDISPEIRVLGIETGFDICVVFKGDITAKKLTLHHYRLTDPAQPIINGPMLASIDPKQGTRFMLFLRREADGRYAPVSGQTDPALFSVLKLEGMAR